MIVNGNEIISIPLSQTLKEHGVHYLNYDAYSRKIKVSYEDKIIEFEIGKDPYQSITRGLESYKLDLRLEQSLKSCIAANLKLIFDYCQNKVKSVLEAKCIPCYH